MLTKVTRRSPFTGKTHTLELPVTPLELESFYASTVPVQVAFPHLTDDQRLFLTSGISPDEAASLLPPVEDEDDEL